MKRILFVDDDPNILMGLRRSLHGLRDQWHMVFAENGDTALTLCGAQPFDAIVSDGRMPGMEGFELLAEVRRAHPDTARIILSGQYSRSSVMKCVAVAHQFLSKPCNPTTLQATVQRACAVRDVFRDVPTRKAIGGVQVLPCQATVYRQLAAQLGANNASIDDIAGIISRDVALSADAMRLVSSGFFGTPQRVTSVAHAAALLGLETIKALWGASAAFQPCALDGREEELQRLTEHGLAVAATAQRIAESMTNDHAVIGNSYLAGLLHEIGTLALGPSTVQRAAGLGELGEDDSVGFLDDEPSVTRQTPDPGGYLAALWGLPDPIVQAIAYHCVPRCSSERTFTPLTAVHVADALLSAADDPWCEAINRVDWDYLQAVGCADRLSAWLATCAA